MTKIKSVFIFVMLLGTGSVSGSFFTVIQQANINKFLCSGESLLDGDSKRDIFLAGLTKGYNKDAGDSRNPRMEKQKEEEQETSTETPTHDTIWRSKQLPGNRIHTHYYFLVSSCYCRPDSSYRKKDYHMFISEAFRLKKPFYRRQDFFREIIANQNFWEEIKGPHPSDGYTTKEAARQGRQNIINSYKKEQYKIHYVPWNQNNN